MFLEKSSISGSIEVITGSMFSGKTEELIRRIKRANIAKLHTTIFKPKIDTRYSVTNVVSHNKTSLESISVIKSKEILNHITTQKVVAIDEAQFFDDDIIEICKQLAYQGIRVIIAGLDMDFLGRPFGPMPMLMAIADDVLKVHAICTRCGSVSQFSYRTSQNSSLVELGETDKYEPLCRKCYNNP